MKKINLDPDALKFWDHLDAKHYRQIGRKVTALALNLSPHDAKALVGCSACFRADCGEYRIIYEVNRDTIEILLIGKRNDDEIYKKFNHKFKYKYRGH